MSFNFCFYIPKGQEIEDNKIVLEELFFHVRLLTVWRVRRLLKEMPTLLCHSLEKSSQ